MCNMSRYPLFFIEKLAVRFGFEDLGQMLFQRKQTGAYLLMISAIILDVPILSTISYFHTGFHPILDIPGWSLMPLLFLLVVYSPRKLHDKYKRAEKSNVGTNQQPPNLFKISPRSRYIILAIGLIIYFATLVSFGIKPLFQQEGTLVGMIKFLLIIPIIYIPAGADLVATFIDVHLLLPRRIKKSALSLDFADPRKLGGMKPIGDILTKSSTYYFTGLIIYTFSTVINIIFNSSQPAMISILFFGTMWLLGVCLFIISIFTIHIHMSDMKHKKEEQIFDELKDIGGEPESFPELGTLSQDHIIKYNYKFIELSQIRATHEYPFRYHFLWQLFSVAIFPVVLQILSIIIY